MSRLATILAGALQAAPVGILGASRHIADLLFPPRCALCDADLDVPNSEPVIGLCSDCAGELGPVERSGCRRCAAPCARGSLIDGFCGNCRLNPPEFDLAFVLGDYRDRLRQAVLRCKRPGSEALAASLARLLASRQRAPIEAFSPDLVVPVPMHWFRRVRRGINGPEIMAQHLAGVIRVPSVTASLVRRRNTKPQAGLSTRNRRRNVKGAFRVLDDQPFVGARVLLVDDILTTGSTCSECARVLRQAGARAVAVAVPSRAMP